MAQPRIDGRLIEWGNRVFYGMPKRTRKAESGANVLLAVASFSNAGAVRARVREVIAPGARQVVLKITGGGRGMKAIAAHFRYISRLGKEEAGGKGQSLELEDEQGLRLSGSEAIRELREDWRYGGGLIPDESERREAFNIVLSMPGGTPSAVVRDAAREFAEESFAGHKYVFALHEDTDAPHVHLVVRAEREDGVRLNPKKAELRVWRERFAQRLQERGVQAVATRAATRGVVRAPEALWRMKAAEKGQLRKPRPADRGRGGQASVRSTLVAWQGLASTLQQSPDRADQELAGEVTSYLKQRFRGVSMQQVTDRREPGAGVER